MKKILMSTLTAGLAFAMMSTYSVQAEENKTTESSILFRGGSFEIVSVSDKLDFGSIDITEEQMTPNLVKDSGFKVTVSDTRGTAEGWGVTAELSSFKFEDSNSLPGTKLVFHEGSKHSTVESNIKSKAPSKASDELVAGGDAVEIIKAKPKEGESFAESEGLGKWDIIWGSDQINLDIPAAVASTGEHTAVIEWTVTDAEQ